MIKIEFDPIFPDEKTYRGLKEPVGAYDANRIGKNHFRIVQQDVIGESAFDLTLEDGYSLVIFDPPYGKTSVPWERRDRGRGR